MALVLARLEAIPRLCVVSYWHTSVAELYNHACLFPI